MLEKKPSDFWGKVTKRTFLEDFLQIHVNYLADWALWHQSTGPEAAEGNLNEVGPQH